MPIYRSHILICGGTGCTSSGAAEVTEAFKKTIAEKGLAEEVLVVPTGCHGMCEMGPIVVVYPEGTFYCRVQKTDVPELVEEHIYKGRPVQRLMYSGGEDVPVIPHYKEIPFYGKQHRIALKNCGYINPDNIDEYIVRGGYEALGKALLSMKPEQVIDEIKASGLRGRGGGGFPTGLKWSFCSSAKGDKKYVICNADEGDPGAFMDRSILEGDPHCVIEGMMLGAYAMGADEGYIYCRAEYPLAIQRLKTAIVQAEEYGLLGGNIMDSGFSFTLHVKEGAGAFVCGEETALMASIEGRRGMPRPRPPFPANSGLWGCPTNINNVETWANVPLVVLEGAEAFRSVGTEGSPGTKVFSLVGKAKHTGLVEVPMGTTLRQIIFDIGGGVIRDRAFKAVQTGGPSGGCIPESLLDLPVDFDRLGEAGSMMGSGGMIVMDDRTCMVDVARYFVDFLAEESCGKCVPCREGLKYMQALLADLCSGRGRPGDVERLREAAEALGDTALCGLGQSAPNPVLSTLRYFPEEYEEHERQGFCRAGVCHGLYVARVEASKCVGCAACAKVCPAGAVEGSPKAAHRVDPAKCVSCGACLDACSFGAIRAVPVPAHLRRGESA